MPDGAKLIRPTKTSSLPDGATLIRPTMPDGANAYPAYKNLIPAGWR
ncbi:Hypothetical protein ABZS17D1_03008 [Kosakonia cowanii]